MKKDIINKSWYDYHNKKNDNIEMHKLNNKEELVKLLKRYKNILAESTLNYLNSLIELEFSVIREYISDDDRKSLSELEIYNRIARYNIYNRALNLFKKTKMKFDISENKFRIGELMISTPLTHELVFHFDYSDQLSQNDDIINKIKTMKIGNILLYQTIESKNLREAELDRVMRILERLYDERNPYSSRNGLIGGVAADWAYQHNQEIAKYEKIFNELDSKKELSDEDKREIEITRQIHDLLLEDYGLTEKSFEEPKNILIKDDNLLQKTLIKKQPNLTIENHIKYI